MTIEINDYKRIQDIQEEFSRRFPYLKIEFFQYAHDREEPSDNMPCDPDQTIGQIRERHMQGIIDVTPDRETGSVEQEFHDMFDLNVQIYRLQMDRWVQTVGTDILTLRQQNEIALDSATFYNPDHELTEDNV